MKKTCIRVLGIILLLTGGLSSVIAGIFELVKFNIESPNVAWFIDPFVNCLSYLVSFSLVGFVFKKIGLFDNKIMSFCYFIVSLAVGGALNWTAWFLEKYILIILIILGSILLILGIVWAIFLYYKEKKL